MIVNKTNFYEAIDKYFIELPTEIKNITKDDFEKMFNSELANKLKYKTIIKNYGSIKISVCDFTLFGDTLLNAEGQLLWWYFQNHCEYPPINYNKTKIRNDEYSISNI